MGNDQIARDVSAIRRELEAFAAERRRERQDQTFRRDMHTTWAQCALMIIPLLLLVAVTIARS